jgi:hypothetical protein
LISFSDIIRNIGFLFCCITGLYIATISNYHSLTLEIAYWALASVAAVVYVVIFTQLKWIFKLLTSR